MILMREGRGWFFFFFFQGVGFFMVDGKETVMVKRRQVMGEEQKGKDEVEECDWWGLYSVTGKDGSWTGNCVAGLLGESTCM
jgi:hypothetical protein